jgi:hypothetical protein
MKFGSMNKAGVALVAALGCGVLMSCTDEYGVTSPIQRNQSSVMAVEGEVLINLWENGTQITDTTYWVGKLPN